MADQSAAPITFAMPEDEDALWHLLVELYRENGLFPLDEPSVREFIKIGTEQAGGLIGLIRGPNGVDGIEASIGMALDQVWYSKFWLISERWVYVHPKARKFNHARRMIDWAKTCSDRLNVPLQMGIMSTTQTAAKEAMYARKLTRVGGIYVYLGDNKPVTTGKRETAAADAVSAGAT